MEALSEIPWRLVAPLLVVQLILISVALLDLRKAHALNGPKWLWVLIIIFVNLLGPVLYFILGKKQR